MLLSVIIPCFNEAKTISTILEQVLAVELDKEVIIVDDHSTDQTPQILERIASQYGVVRTVRHEQNKGKGGAIRTGLSLAQGEIIIIQDADLEYDPNDYYELISPIVLGRVDVVFGARFSGRHTGMYFWNAIGNKSLTFLTNLFCNSWISDMETCYKVMRTDVMRSLALESRDFRIEPEMAAKVLRLGYRIYEVPISYMGRTYEEGKKIRPSDGLKAIFTLLRYLKWRGNAPALAQIDPEVSSKALTSIRQHVGQPRIAGLPV
jgi:glycosyltransferase involved in cell wall biosynthesis